jgi:lysyl-tRNA synthetase class 2
VTISPIEMARARARLQGAVRAHLAARGFDEVETPCLVPAPGMEPHIHAFETAFVPETGVPEAGGGSGDARPLWLHSSPEYAMKRLLADGFDRIFQFARVFRNGEISSNHNPEFTMLEMYRAGTDQRGIMEDLEQAVEAGAWALHPGGGTQLRWRGHAVDFAAPFDRVSVAEAFARAGVNLESCGEDERKLRAAAIARGLDGGPEGERFELYAAGLEMANGFSELNDAAEQRRRLLEEQGERRRLARPVYPLDERFLAAVGRMPDAGGVALGLDRLLMLLTGAERIRDVLLFPAEDFLRAPGARDT